MGLFDQRYDDDNDDNDGNDDNEDNDEDDYGVVNKSQCLHRAYTI